MTALLDPAPAATPYYPVPAGRGRWRLQLMRRQFDISTRWADSIVAEVPDARSRRLEVKPDGATLTFTLDGHSPSAALLAELRQDVVAWRWDETTGYDVPVFRGPVCQSQDSLSENVHTVTVTCHSYLEMMKRRILTAPYTCTQRDQDSIVADLVGFAQATRSSSGTSFAPGAWLPLIVANVGPDGSARAASGQLRDRVYTAGSELLELLDNLSKVVGGFGYDVLPFGFVSPTNYHNSCDTLRVFYPRQGVTRSDFVLAYGSTVASLSRSVNSADYANYVRLVGNNGASAADAPQLYSEKWNADANDVTRVPVGLWQSHGDASDVSVQATLDQMAAAELATSGVLVPSYSLGLVPGAYKWGRPRMGDTCQLVVQSGRLNVLGNVDVVGLDFEVTDDGAENVTLAVGRPAVTFGDLFTELDSTVNALTRR